MSSFSYFGLLSSLQRTLKEKNFLQPTEIQIKAIPPLTRGESLVGISETGSGKTLAYALPLLHSLKALEVNGDPVKNESQPRAIIIVPARDLGEQISKVFKTLTHDTRLRVRPALGGMTMEQSRRNVSSAFEILLATPGRLVQLMEIGAVDLTEVRTIVIDEADQMLDPGFIRDTKVIVAACPQAEQRVLFSATISKQVEQLISQLFADAEVVRSKGSGKTVATLVTKNLKVEDGKRWPVLEKALEKDVEGGTILFTNTREQCDRLAKELKENGYDCVVYRGEMEKNARRTNLKRFRDGKVELLVATDLAGRGLDIENVGRVINYHLPKEMENYIHRVGRTARAGRSGLVVNLITERDEALIAKLAGKSPEKKSTDRKSSETKTLAKSPVRSAVPTSRRPPARATGRTTSRPSSRSK